MGDLKMTTYRDLVEIKSCAKCGKTTGLEVHHKNMNRCDNKRCNLTVLCRSCHHNLHNENWMLEDIGIKTPEFTYNPSQTAFYNVTTADIQRELDEMGDPVTDIMKFD